MFNLVLQNHSCGWLYPVLQTNCRLAETASTSSLALQPYAYERLQQLSLGPCLQAGLEGTNIEP